jgi:hypothetical protein
MERNLLIHFASARSLVVHAAYGVGGSWHGAKEALRKKYKPLFIQNLHQEDWCRALVAMGAIPLNGAQELPYADVDPGMEVERFPESDRVVKVSVV